MKLYLLVISLSIYSLLNAQSNYPYKNSKLPVEQRVKDLVSRMTTIEKIKQLDMYWGYQVADTTGHESTAFNLNKVQQSLGKEGVGSVHDFYPISADITNKIQRYAMEHTRLGIPVLFIEEGLHGYLGAGSTTFPIPLQLSSAWDTLLVHDIGKAIATE
ncbi:MAG TPA: glycoside hydrolase family 3 N-terminal domain-containing protein, partial [Parafilimonas sp.]